MDVRPAIAAAALAALTVGSGAAVAASPASASTLASSSATAAAAAVPAKSGDFNGDGRRDIAMGSPLGTTGGVRTGFVTVVFGGGTGPNTGRRQVITQNSAGVPGTATANNAFGASTASADFDMDGYADLAIGVPGEDVEGRTHAGTVAVVYGSATGLSARAARLVLPDPAFRNPNGRFGTSLAVGDLTGDSRPDLAVNGGSAGFWVFDALATGGARGTRVPLNDDNFYATDLTLTAADFTGDGRTDVAASWVEEVDGLPSGRVDLYRGTGTGMSLLKSYAAGGGPEAAAGDFNGDGKADLVTRLRPVEGPDVAGGRIIVSLGTGTGFRRQATFSQDTAGVPGSGEDGDFFGADLAAGDVTGDGKADLVVGSPGEDIGSVGGAGAFTVLYGSGGGITTAGARLFAQNTSGVPGTVERNDAFGGGLSVANVTGDGKADIAVGAPQENSTEGAVWIFRGAAARVSASGVTAFNAVTVGVGGRAAHLGGVLLP
ncbi:MAG TPA: FG-GAP repeat protein [Streptosporangiaceae bacterium]|nr:FG-GAP repeat protein [Streptosporangiaceae bacterium]